MVEYIVAIDVTRVRFPADAFGAIEEEVLNHVSWRRGAFPCNHEKFKAESRPTRNVTRPGLEPGISGSGGRRLIH